MEIQHKGEYSIPRNEQAGGQYITEILWFRQVICCYLLNTYQMSYGLLISSQTAPDNEITFWFSLWFKLVEF